MKILNMVLGVLAVVAFIGFMVWHAWRVDTLVDHYADTQVCVEGDPCWDHP